MWAFNLTTKFFWNRKAIFVFVVHLLFKHVGLTQDCREVNADSGFTVRSVQIKARWVPDELKKTVTDIIGIGGPFSNSKVSTALALVSEASKASENYFPPQLSGAIAVSLMTVNYCAASDSLKEVDVIIYPRYLRIDLFNIGNNFLPIPRSPTQTFYDKVPGVLLALAPVIGFGSDRSYGPSIAIQTATDLLHLTNPSKGSKNLKLNLGLEARKSFTNDFHTLGGTVELTKPLKNSGLGWGVGMGFINKEQPLGVGKYGLENFSLQGMLQGSTQFSFIKKYTIGGGFRSLQNDYDTLPSKTDNNTEKGYTLFLITDGMLKKNFSRFGLWFDHGLPENETSYQRLSAKMAYGAHIKAGNNAHQTFDLEMTAGGGYSWGHTPVYNQFYAGNTASHFLYESMAATRIRAVPDGPIVRSIGEREGTLSANTESTKGGRSYWHFNMNLSIPVGRWSKPLIPDMVINETTGATLQSKLKSLAMGSAISGVAIDLIDNKGYPENEQTDSIAEGIVEKDIMPMIEFVTDRANVFSIKPVLLFDVAGMEQPGLPQKTWTAAGAGFQLTVVIARLRAGYMHTITPSSEKGKGNFFLQFVFENFY